MKKLLLVLALFVHETAQAQGQPIRLKEAVADFPRSQLQLKTNGPVSMEVNSGARAAYETLGEVAGINVVFDPDFRDGAIEPFRIENADVLQAFDLISARTNSFVEVLNSKTVLVAPDNPTKRRDYEFQVLKIFYLPSTAPSQRLTEMVTTLRTTLRARYIAVSTVANAVIMRDPPDRIALAEKTIGLSMPIVAGAAAATMGETIRGNHILTLEAGAVRDSAPALSVLKLSATGPVSFKMKESTRTMFETVARVAGLNVIFDADFRSQDGQAFKVDDVAILDALDILALQTRAFWTPVDGKTILVAPDNQTKRRELESVTVKTFFVPNATQVELVEMVTALRAILNARYVATVAGVNAIVVRDASNKLALADRILSDLRRSGGITSADGFAAGAESGFLLNRRAAKALSASTSPLQPRVRGPFSFDLHDSARASYEALAAMAGLRVVFDSRFQDAAAAPLQLQNVDVVDALDFLSLETRNIWQMMDNETILVAPENPTVRADILPRVTETIQLSKLLPNINDVVTALRTILNIHQVSTLEDSIVLQDTAENVAFAEKLVADLEKAGGR